MKIFPMLAIAAMIMITSCREPLGVEEQVRITPIITEKALNLDSLAIGQRARFIFSEIRDGYSLANQKTSREFHDNDTLILEVYGRNDEGWIFREYITKHDNTVDSLVVETEMLRTNSKGDTIEYFVNINGNEFTAFMPGQDDFSSFLFYSVGTSGIMQFSLDEYNDTLVKMDYWINPFRFSRQYSKGYIANFQHGASTFDRINILQFNDNRGIDVFSGIQQPLLIFSKKYGFTRKINFYNDTTDRFTVGNVWDLIHN